MVENATMNGRQSKQNIGLIIGIAILILTALLPAPAGLSVAGKNSIGLLVSGIVMWVTEALPLAISAMMLMILLPFYGVTPQLSDVFKDFVSPVIFFIIATFALTTIIIKTPLATRLTRRLVGWAGDSSEKLVLGFMIGVAFLSAVMSNVPTTLLFMALGIAILQANNAQVGKSNLGKCIMIGIPFAAMLGGAATPAGTAINIMAMYLLEQATSIHITFLGWMVMGIPIVVIMVLVSWWYLIKVFPPEKISHTNMSYLYDDPASLGPLSGQEKKVITIITAMLVLWISSTWVPWLDTTTVAIAGLVTMFLPGINVITWDEFISDVSWEIVLLIGGVQSLAAGILNTGAADWMVSSFITVAAQWGSVLTTAAASTLMAFMHVIIPVGPAIAGMSVIPMAGVASSIGANPVVYVMLTAFMSGITFLLPIDCVPLITYSRGYYSMGNFIRAGWFPTVVLILLCTFLLPPLAALAGY